MQFPRIPPVLLAVPLLLVGLAVSGTRFPPIPEVSPLTIDYPLADTVFPPDMAAPTFIWRDPVETSRAWLIEVTFDGGSPAIRIESSGPRVQVGEIDPRCISETNEVPKLTPEQAASRTWTPDRATWELIKKQALGSRATVAIAGFTDQNSSIRLSLGNVTIQISRDPAGAPIFYRDVPLMPTETERGVIKPIVPSALPLIAWRLRDVGENESRLVMQHLPTCANCHSFSQDGRTLGMDLDGPQNDKSMYAVAPVSPRMTIRTEDVISWSAFPGLLPGHPTIAFMPQLSPSGRHAIATLNEEVYVANFKDYRFLQVFYPTRGILAWYSSEARRVEALPGADDPNYVHTNAVWSPDGRYLVFARAGARDPYPTGRKLAVYANDPNETPIQFDLYRIPFDNGRGGWPQPIKGASHNGMSNSFPRVSPDGRWIVFVQSRNGQLMRPDGQLYIVPTAGGKARRMRCNTPLMNSWHSFSPNGRWMVFSSKGQSPFTQMFLTHVDEDGNDSPAVLVENATAANRAVNLPEFVNIPRDGLVSIEVPAAEFYRLFDRAWNLGERGENDAAIAEWRKALAISPDDAKAHNNFGISLWRQGAFDEAIVHYQRALQINPDYAEANNNLGVALVRQEKWDPAIANFEKALERYPESADLHNNLGRAYAGKGRLDTAIKHWRKAVELNPNSADVRNNLGTGLFRSEKWDQAIDQWQKAVEINPGFLPARYNLGRGLAQKGRFDQAIMEWQKTIESQPRFADAHLSLGEAFCSQGRTAEALEEWKTTLRLAIEQNQASLADSVKARLERCPSCPCR
ncbi:MAG: tetratricopeptide repeat protein [Acidobacteria bacterium]|nr:MAG: tetratricopeptide repeat protein [Acidobacteriota bacterium]